MGCGVQNYCSAIWKIHTNTLLMSMYEINIFIPLHPYRPEKAKGSTACLEGDQLCALPDASYSSLTAFRFLSRNTNQGKKNCYQHCYTESFSLEWVSAKQVASLIYIVVTKSALLLVDFLGSGCCDHENQIEQGTGYTFCGIISAPLLLRAEQKPVGCSWTWMAPRGFCYSSAAWPPREQLVLVTVGHSGGTVTQGTHSNTQHLLRGTTWAPISSSSGLNSLFPTCNRLKS